MVKKTTKKTSKLAKSQPDSVELSLREINSLIKTCRKNNVLSLKCKGIELTLQDQDKEDLEKVVSDQELPAKSPDQDVSTEKKPVDNEVDFEERLDMLRLQDPEEFEKLIYSGDTNGENQGRHRSKSDI